MKVTRIGEVVIPVDLNCMVEMTNERRKWRGQPLLPKEITQDNLKINFNSEEFEDNLINVAFLAHLPYDILVPYPCTAWMQTIFPNETFTEVQSINYYQKINGDCELTHAFEDLFRIIRPGGIARIGVPNFEYVLRMINEIQDDTTRLKWEHYLYSRNVDEKGLFYNQSLCGIRRISNRGRFAGFRSIEEDSAYGQQYTQYLNMIPEDYDLPGVDKKEREEFQKRLADTSIRRKRCVVPGCDAKAGQQELRRVQSVYCRRHYRKAKAKLEELQQKALRLVVILKKE